MDLRARQRRWYHANAINTSFFNDTVRAQGIDPATHAHLVDPFTHRVFGAHVSGAGLSPVEGSGGLHLSTASDAAQMQPELELRVKILTMTDTQPEAWLETVEQLVPASPAAHGTSPVDCRRERGSTTRPGGYMQGRLLSIQGVTPIQGTLQLYRGRLLLYNKYECTYYYV